MNKSLEKLAECSLAGSKISNCSGRIWTPEYLDKYLRPWSLAKAYRYSYRYTRPECRREYLISLEQLWGLSDTWNDIKALVVA